MKCIGLLLLTFIFLNNVKAQDDGRTHERVYKDFKAELVWEANVKIGEMINHGESKRGVRRVISILGGAFSGSNISGTVLPMRGESYVIIGVYKLL